MKFDMARNRRSVEQELKTFAQEVIEVLRCHAGMYDSKLGDFQIYNHECPANNIYFSENTMKAVFTLAYLFRAQCNDLYHKNYDDLKTDYNRFLMARVITRQRDHSYFMQLLTWISFAFEMTMCCYRNEFRANKVNPKFCIYSSRWCFEQYPDMNVLLDTERENIWWWSKIQEAANHIAAFYTPVKELMIQSKTRCFIALLQAVLKDLLKLNKYKLKMTEILSSDRNSKYCLNHNAYPLWQYGPERIALGHTVRRKNKPADKSWLNSKKRSTMSERIHDSHENVPSTSSGVSPSNVLDDKKHFQFDSFRKSAFVLSGNKLEKIKSGKNSCKQDIKIYWHRQHIMGKVENLYSLLEEHIAKYTNKSLYANLFLVNLRHGFDKKGSDPIIVMDSSSEEEDDDKFDRLQRSLIDGQLQKCKYFSPHDVEEMNFALSSQMGTVGIYHYLETSLNVRQLEPHR